MSHRDNREGVCNDDAVHWNLLVSLSGNQCKVDLQGLILYNILQICILGLNIFYWSVQKD